MDPKVQEALALLQQAGRLDLLKDEALAPGHPVRRASSGVAAAVAACSPPHAVLDEQVRREGKRAARGVGLRASRACRGRARGGARAPGSPRAGFVECRSGGLRSDKRFTRRSPGLKRTKPKPRVGQREAVGAHRGRGSGTGRSPVAESEGLGPRGATGARGRFGGPV
ncbi:hypothetical protein NDU88_007791 [Pleurodeles waltl]|uniref:Uncharacterized protein n=1 Tax=Pleurodeles waltl TaxID=8319 RepID=A0AAV7RSS9_PLEWA|nr:hypothetical protein NDU88_007791 [Pleurodeles waltl]